jgi:hypothetical protein
MEIRGLLTCVLEKLLYGHPTARRAAYLLRYTLRGTRFAEFVHSNGFSSLDFLKRIARGRATTTMTLIAVTSRFACHCVRSISEFNGGKLQPHIATNAPVFFTNIIVLDVLLGRCVNDEFAAVVDGRLPLRTGGAKKKNK